MWSDESHIADHELLQAADGELASGRASQVAAHLAGCWLCRTRKQELKETVAEFVRLHHSMGNPLPATAAGRRSLLKARLAHAAASAPRGWFPRPVWGYAAALALMAIGGAAYGGASSYAPTARLETLSSCANHRTSCVWCQQSGRPIRSGSPAGRPGK